MKIEEIEITIGADGKVRLETSGFSGEACLAETKELEALLGNLITERQTKAEFFDRPAGNTAEQVKIHR